MDDPRYMADPWGHQPWCLEQLSLARACRPTADALLNIAYSRTSHEIEVARWRALGRTNEEALIAINGQGGGGANNLAVVAR